MSHPAELSTQQAADLLNVSGSFVVGLIDGGQLSHHKVGTDDRVRFSDLMTYMRQRDADSEAAFKELAAISQHMKLY